MPRVPGVPGVITDKSTLSTLGTPNFRHKKKGKLLISHRYNCLPLLPSDPGGVQQELVV